MRLIDKTVLITGGSEGVGFELAKALLPANTVLVCGRSEAKLDRARADLPGLQVYACDVTKPEQRRRLRERVLAAHPGLDVLINNAGGRARVDLASNSGAEIEDALHLDLTLNFSAPASLCVELLDQLRARPEAAIVNVTTGLVYLPKAAQPFYCAAKAALHSYTRSLRWALRGTSLRVFEVLLPLVATNFHHGNLPDTVPATTAAEAARGILRGVARDRSEIHVGKAGLARWIDFVAPRRGLELINR